MIAIYRSLEEAEGRFGPCALTVGNFDGVHAGHRSILHKVVRLARERGWKPSVLTFDPHPAVIVAPERAPRLLTTPEQRALLMQDEGIVQVLVEPFTRELSRLSPEQFVREILRTRLDARGVLVGENFRFGYEHAGDTRLLAELGRKYGFETEVVSAVSRRGCTVSSSEIRRLIALGRVWLASRLLERPYALEGAVVKGRGIGSKKTVPTLNLAPGAELLPATGVYITRTFALEGPEVWPSVTNVGCQPTFGGDTLAVETFLLGPLEGAAPPAIRVEFLRRLRGERQFASPEELRLQILRDAARSQIFFRRLKRWVRSSAAG